jgi:signal peptidase I
MPRLEYALGLLAERAEPMPVDVLLRHLEAQLTADGTEPDTVIASEPDMPLDPTVHTGLSAGQRQSRWRGPLVAAGTAVAILVLVPLSMFFLGADTDDATIDPVTTTVAVDATSSTVVSTTSLAHATTVSVDTAAEAAEAFNESMATVVELSVLLGAEFNALTAYLEEHRTEFSEGVAIDTCCGAHIERIKVYDRLMAEEIASLYGQNSNLTPWVEELSRSLLSGGQQGLKQGIGVLDELRMLLAMHWSEVGWGSDTIHIDAAIGLLYHSQTDADDIASYVGRCCPMALNSSTMEDTIQIDGRVAVDRDDTDPQRSDIIIFTRPFYEAVEFTARVIALPTETVEGRYGGVYVNDRLLSEPYVKDGNTGQPFAGTTLGANEYWVMGDNRGAVDQPRFFGLINATQIIGTVTDIENP